MILHVIVSVFVFMNIFFLIALTKKNFGLVDIAWGLGFIVISLVSYFHHFNSMKNAVLLFMILIWGFRLALYLLGRNWNAPEDFRYQDLRKSWGAHPNLHAYFKVFILQGVLMLLISLPITLGMMRAETELSLVNKIGIFIWALGLSFEAYSDRYLRKYKAYPANRGTICMSGPWKLCRFPNYLGEITLWYGIYLAAFTTSTWWTIIGPIIINFFILKISGVPLLENKYLKRPEYKEYAARVPRLIPFSRAH